MESQDQQTQPGDGAAPGTDPNTGGTSTVINPAGGTVTAGSAPPANEPPANEPPAKPVTPPKPPKPPTVPIAPQAPSAPPVVAQQAPKAAPPTPVRYGDIADGSEIVAQVGPRMGGPKMNKEIDPARQIVATKAWYETFDREADGEGKHCPIKLLGVPDYDLTDATRAEAARGYKITTVIGDFAA